MIRLQCMAGFALVMALSCTPGSTMDSMDTSTVKKLDLDRYLGTWYEIARFPNSFEKGLVGVTATYSLRPDGKIRVVNQGYRGSLDGKRSRSVGKAKVPDPKDPGKLKVSFFLFFYGDYYVLELDEDYEWALVGSSTPRYLWILSRTPNMEPEVFDRLVKVARSRGYDTDRLIRVEQP